MLDCRLDCRKVMAIALSIGLNNLSITRKGFAIVKSKSAIHKH